MVAGYYVHAYNETVGVVRTCVTARYRGILSVHYGVIKLYFTSESSALDKMDQSRLPRHSWLRRCLN